MEIQKVKTVVEFTGSCMIEVFVESCGVDSSFIIPWPKDDGKSLEDALYHGINNFDDAVWFCGLFNWSQIPDLTEEEIVRFKQMGSVIQEKFDVGFYNLDRILEDDDC